MNREGPRIQPGPRCYRRSWIRDGALTGTALAEMGFADEARAFLSWYAPHQLPDGRVPCAIDHRGIDRAVEHDSHGELAWAIVELWRLTGDDAFLRRLWPLVRERAPTPSPALRSQRTGDAFRGDARFGLLPESISHEGYSSKPVHSFWDDFFALRGVADAADAAAAVGESEARARFETLRDAMRRDVAAAVVATMERHRLDVIPGSVELGDFDPTSTAIAFDPCGEEALLPRAALERTFERLWQELEARWRGERPLEAYTAYEVRNAVALLRLGWKERALSLLAELDRRPAADRLAAMAGGHDARPDARRASWATCPTAGSRRASCAACADSSSTNGGTRACWSWRRAYRRPGCAMATECALDSSRRSSGRSISTSLPTAKPDCAPSSAAPATRPAVSCSSAPSPRSLRQAFVDGRPAPVTAPDRLTLNAMPGEVILLL